MKTTAHLILACSLFGNIAFGSSSSDITAEIPSPVLEIKLPADCHDSSRLEVILTGEYPNTCYKPAKTEVQIDQNTRLINITATTFKSISPRVMCAMVIKPFQQKVKLDKLAAGKYLIRVNGQEDLQKELVACE